MKTSVASILVCCQSYHFFFASTATTAAFPTSGRQSFRMQRADSIQRCQHQPVINILFSGLSCHGAPCKGRGPAGRGVAYSFPIRQSQHSPGALLGIVIFLKLRHFRCRHVPWHHRCRLWPGSDALGLLCTFESTGIRARSGRRGQLHLEADLDTDKSASVRRMDVGSEQWR